ncbi:MAG: glycosyltransferase family 2 protein [Dongiaceae bacterium]
MADPAAGRRYLLISPCRDEAPYIGRTIDSVARQTLPPAAWIVVDDGSTDGSPELLRGYAAKLPFLRIVERGDRGFRHVGAGVVETFDFGLAQVRLEDFDYVCKLDMDLEMPPGYFARVIERLEAEPRLGTFSGKPYYVDPTTGQRVSEYVGDDHSAGQAKFYKVTCFREIGGFVRGLLWDAIDCHTCRMLGWRAESADEPSLRYIHLRPMGSSQVSLWHGRVRFGRSQWFMGTHPLYMLALTLYRLSWRPVVVSALAISWGYLGAWLRGTPRYDNPAFRRFLRRYQLEVLLYGRRRALARAEARGAAGRARRAATAGDAP